MIFYKNLKSHKKVNEKDLTFSIFADGFVSGADDSVAKAGQCKSAYNLVCRDGALKTGVGFRFFEVPKSLDDLSNTDTYKEFTKLTAIKSIWLDRWHSSINNTYNYQIMMVDESMVLYSIDVLATLGATLWRRTKNITADAVFSCPYRVGDEDATLIFTPNEMLYLGPEVITIYTNLPQIYSLVVHYDKIFALENTNRNSLIYTDNLNVKEWSNDKTSLMEFLDNRGIFTKLVAFNDYVYLFREYGITRISIYSSKSDFSCTHLYTSSSKIYENTVCVCGDKVIFLTNDGMYAFNGTSVTKIAKNYDSLLTRLDNSNSSSACLDGKYYVATKCAFDDGQTVGCENGEFVNNVLLEYDIMTDSLSVGRGEDVRQLLTVNTPYLHKVVACFNNEFKRCIGEVAHVGKVLDTVVDKSWKSFMTDLGIKSKRKRVKEIRILTHFDCEVEIVSDEQSKVFKFAGSEKEQRLPVSILGRKFQFEFRTNNADCDIEKPTIIYDVVA